MGYDTNYDCIQENDPVVVHNRECILGEFRLEMLAGVSTF